MVPVQETTMEGIDLSYWQGEVDFAKMKAAGIKFVIIRAGYGTSTIDKRFITYINGAIKAGLAIGVYWFIYAADKAASTKNANKCIEVIKPYKIYINCGVWADFEYDSDIKAGGKLTPKTRSAIVENFNTLITKAGYEAGIYSNQDYIKHGKFTPELIAKYPLWFAKYSRPYVNTYACKGLNSIPYIVQYTSSGVGSKYGVSSSKVDVDHGFFNIKAKATTPPADKVTTNSKSIKASDNPYIKPTRIIKYTPGKSLMYGDDVKWVQWHLWRFGLLIDAKGKPDKSQIDGKFGPKSMEAVKEAQKRLSINFDGIVGPTTIAKFMSV